METSFYITCTSDDIPFISKNDGNLNSPFFHKLKYYPLKTNITFLCTDIMKLVNLDIAKNIAKSSDKVSKIFRVTPSNIVDKTLDENGNVCECFCTSFYCDEEINKNDLLTIR